MKKYILIILFILCVVNPSWGAVLFSDNFNSDSNWTVTQHVSESQQCYTGACGTPDGWTSYNQSGSLCDGLSGEPGNNSMYVNSYAGFPGTSATCRGGSGKCFTKWQEACLANPQFDDSDANLGYDWGTEQTDVYMRFYMRFSTPWAIPSGVMFKTYHIQHRDEVAANPWQYFGANTDNQPVSSGGVVNYDGTVFLYANVRGYPLYYCYGDMIWPLGTTAWAAAAGGIFDGDWHRIEYRFKVNSAPGVADGLIEIWFDGVKKTVSSGYDADIIPWNTSGGENRGLRFASIGGNNMSWQSVPAANMAAAERWYAIDDVCISDSYIGDSVCGGASPSVPNLTGVTITGGTVQ